jgi:hypothetical protein
VVKALPHSGHWFAEVDPSSLLVAKPQAKLGNSAEVQKALAAAASYWKGSWAIATPAAQAENR